MSARTSGELSVLCEALDGFMLNNGFTRNAKVIMIQRTEACACLPVHTLIHIDCINRVVTAHYKTSLCGIGCVTGPAPSDCLDLSGCQVSVHSSHWSNGAN